MGFFSSKKESSEGSQQKSKSDKATEIIQRPKICCLDLSTKFISELRAAGYNIYDGSLGARVQLPTLQGSKYALTLLNYDFPKNILEYDIFIVDLSSKNTIPYDPDVHVHSDSAEKVHTYFANRHPQSIFDPRPLASRILKTEIEKIRGRPIILIIFGCAAYEIEYEPVEVSMGSAEAKKTFKHNIYSLNDHIPVSSTVHGREIRICTQNSELRQLFLDASESLFYDQAYYHPKTWQEKGPAEIKNFIPFLRNLNDEVVSFAHFVGNQILMVFPQIKEKGEFLKGFLSRVGPSISAELFPYSTMFAWKSDEAYWLPNHAKLISQKDQLISEYEQKLKESDEQIAQNKLKFDFLHKILTETGDDLVASVCEFMRWLDFSDVRSHDEHAEIVGVLEEDIQIDIPEGLIIIECKGIGGTSTDADCSQISKIKHRRCKERNRFDVYALYIVNHERYKAPISRQNPPFSSEQLQDAVSDERGLLTTWQLFNLFSDIEAGVITKAEARQALLKFGLVEFIPLDLVLLDEPREILKDGYVCIVNVKNVRLQQGDKLWIERNGRFRVSKVIGCQKDDKPVNEITSGEYGIKLDVPVDKKSKPWVRKAISPQ